MDKTKTQKILAQTIMTRLSEKIDYEIALAGGALASWELGQVARDLDFYVHVSSLNTPNELKSWAEHFADCIESLGYEDVNVIINSGYYDMDYVKGLIRFSKRSQVFELVVCNINIAAVIDKFDSDVSRAIMFRDGRIVGDKRFKEAFKTKTFEVIKKPKQSLDQYKRRVSKLMTKFPAGKGWKVIRHSSYYSDEYIPF